MMDFLKEAMEDKYGPVLEDIREGILKAFKNGSETYWFQLGDWDDDSGFWSALRASNITCRRKYHEADHSVDFFSWSSMSLNLFDLSPFIKGAEIFFNSHRF